LAVTSRATSKDKATLRLMIPDPAQTTIIEDRFKTAS